MPFAAAAYLYSEAAPPMPIWGYPPMLAAFLIANPYALLDRP